MAAYTPGTWKNKINQMIVYKKFVSKYKLSPINPSKYQIMSYVAFLYNKYRTPGTVYNYLSGAKTWVKLKGGNADAFDDFSVKLIKRGVAKVATHKVKQAPPLSIKVVKKVIRTFTKAGHNADVFKAVTLISYFSLLRQSNLVLTGLAGSPSHVLRQKDIKVVGCELQITVRSTKTSSIPADQFIVCIPEVTDKRYCPVLAWKTYFSTAPKNPGYPAFWTRQGKPLTASLWLAVMRYALKQNCIGSSEEYTLHSLRRGGAQACEKRGTDPSLVKEAGRWKSNSVYEYIPKRVLRAVPAALASFFG